MVKAKIPLIPTAAPADRTKRTARQTTQESLVLLRIKELDREFARQTKQLTALTKKFGKKLNQPITFTKKTKN